MGGSGSGQGGKGAKWLVDFRGSQGQLDFTRAKKLGAGEGD